MLQQELSSHHEGEGIGSQISRESHRIVEAHPDINYQQARKMAMELLNIRPTGKGLSPNNPVIIFAKEEQRRRERQDIEKVREQLGLS